MTAALVALGSNLGDRQATLSQAVRLLAERSGARLVAVSQLHSTRPVGGPAGQDAFFNSAALFETALSSAEFFAAMRQVELALGRRRDAPRWSARTIDLDLLLFGNEVTDSAELTLPHPRMAFRRFVIEPAAEIAPDMRHPTTGRTLAELREHLRSAPPYIAIAGMPGAGKTKLAVDVAATLAGIIDVRVLLDPAAHAISRAGVAGATGPSKAREIELLELRSAQLSAVASGEHVCISDYWLDQALCLAELTLRPEDWQEYRRQCDTVAAAIVPPKLLVLLDAPLEAMWDRAWAANAERLGFDKQSFARLQRGIVERANEHGRAPLLRLDCREPDVARLELAAAVEAMGSS